MDSDSKDLAAAVAKGSTQAVLKPFYDLWDNLVLPHLEGVKDRKSDYLQLERLKNLHALKAKWDRFVKDAGINPGPVSPKIFLPILEYASVEDDENLHTRWAALLANSSKPGQEDKTRVAFADILHQMSSRDAQFLDLLYDDVCSRATKGYGVGKVSANSVQGIELNLNTVDSLYDALPHDQLVKTSNLTFADDFEALNVSEHLSRKAVILRNCMRLGLLDRILKLGRIDTLLDGKLVPQETFVFLTALGYEFVRACRPPQAESA